MKLLKVYVCLILVLCFSLVAVANNNHKLTKKSRRADVVKVKQADKQHLSCNQEQPVKKRADSSRERVSKNSGIARPADSGALDTQLPGDNCDNPVIVGSLPFTDTGQYTCGRGHSIDLDCIDWVDTNNEDIVYEWTVTTADNYYIYIDTHTDSQFLIALLDACPDNSIAANCLYTDAAWMDDAYLLRCEFMDVGTYYLVISSFYDSDTYCLSDFDIEIGSCSSGGCTADYTMTAPFTDERTPYDWDDTCYLTPGSTNDAIYEVIIPHDGIWEFTLCGSDGAFDLFLGTTCCSRDIGEYGSSYCPGVYGEHINPVSQYRRQLTAGTYYATIENYYSLSNSSVFSVTEIAPPAQLADNCEDAIVVSQLPFVADGYTDVNTNTIVLSCNDEDIEYYAPSPDVYFIYTPAANTTISATTCGSLFDTIMEIFEGCPTSGGLSLGCSDDDGCSAHNESCLSGIYLTAGISYYIVLEGYEDYRGTYHLSVTEGNSGCVDVGSCPNPVAGGETIADAPAIFSLPFEACYNNCDYADDYDGGCASSGGSDVVYAYTPTNPLRLDINTCGSDFDTQLYVLDSNENVIDCNDDDHYYICEAGGNSTLLNILLSANETYYIVVDGYNDRECGLYYLSINGEDATPADNAECANAEMLSLPATVTGNTANGGQPLGSECDENIAPGLWYKVTGDGNLMTASTCSENTDYDTYISVYENGCETLTCVGYNDDAYCESTDQNVSRFSWCGEPGTEYLVFVHGYDGEFGLFELTVTSEPDVACGGACVCQTLENTFCGPDLPAAIPDGPGDSLWVTINEPFQHVIERISVCFDITHPAVEELIIALFPPAGYVAGLVIPGDASGANFTCTTIDDYGPYFYYGTAPYSGSFHGYNDLGDFVGEEAQGDWRLLFLDNAAGNSGTLNYVCIHFETDEILPVELTGFDAVPGDRQITLNWATASETDNDHFDIMRNGTTVGRIPAFNSVSGSNYSWTELNLINGRVYTYTLYSVDVSGNRENIGSVSAVPSFNSATITEYALQQNYPNPFNPSTSITFDLVESGHTKLSVFNTLGQTVAALVNGEMTAGRHTVNFDATALPSGLYFYQLEAGGFTAVRKMILMK